MMKRAGIFLLLLLLFGMVSWAQYDPLTVPDLPNLEVRRVERARQDSLRMGNLPPVERRAVAPPERSLLQISRFPEVQHRRVVAPEISKFIGPQLPRVELLSIAEFKDFKGGLNLSSYKTKVAPNQAIVLENALWNEQGEMYKRPGYDTLKTTPEVFNFLYRYYQQDGDKYLMGGSDTALYFWQEDSTSWTYLTGTGSYTGRWDGCTFEDMFIGTHEGITPIAWDGSTLINVGEQSYSYDSSWAANCSLYVHVKNVAWDDDQFVGFYAVQGSGAYSDSVLPFGQIVHNGLDVLVIRSSLSSGVNPWGTDQAVTILSALEDSVWAAGIIDTFYTMSEQSEVLVPSADSSRVEWTEVPAGDCYSTINDYPDITSHDDYSYTTDTTSVMMVGFGNHTSALVDVGRVWLNIIASTNIDQEIGTAVMVAVRLCFQDSNEYFSWLWQVDQGLENFPYDKKYTRFQAPMSTNPAGHPWTDDGVDSLTLYMMATNQAGGGFGFGDQRLEVFDAWLAVEYEAEALACGFMVFDTSLFDTGDLLDTDITVPTYFELIPAGYDGTPGSPSKTTRQIIDIDSGIYVDAANPTVGNFAYLKLAEPEISGLAVGDSFQLKHLYFPTSKFVENYDEALWIGWAGTGADQNKNVVLYSEPGDIANWPAGNEISIESDDGDYITGMTQFYPDQQGHRAEPWAELVVSKEQSLYRIYPTTFLGELDYNTMFISRGVGCCSNLAMQMIEGKFIAFPDQHGVWLYNGTGVQPISLPIDPIFEDLELEGLEATSAIYNPQNRHYIISLPVDIDTVVNGEFITTFHRDSAGTDDQYVHLMTTLDGEQDNDIKITDDTASAYCDIASDTLGNYCVLVRDQYNLFLFRFDSLNARVGATIKINDEDQKVTPGEAHVDMNNHGKIVVVWEDFRDGSYPSGTWDVYGQCLGFSYGKNGTNFHVNSAWETIEKKAEHVSVAINDDSVIVFTWRDWNDTDFQTCIFAAIDNFPVVTVANAYFKPFGGWHNPNGGCVLLPSGAQGACVNSWGYPDVDAGDTTFVIVCIDDPQEAYGRYIVMNYDLDTLVMGLTGQVEMNGSQQPSVSMNKKGRFVVTWMQLKGASDYKIWAIKYDIGGTVSGVYFRVDDAADGISTTYPAVALNDQDQYCIVWWDERCGVAEYYRCYTWDGGAVSGEAFLNDICNIDGAYYEPEIAVTNIWLEIDTTKETYAWNIDYHGWSKETFSASAYAYQHGLTDPVKVIFADPEEAKVYNYGTQADDVNDAVILTYQSPYMSFTEYPYWENFLRYATIEAYLDTGTIYLDFYADYSTLVHQDSIVCGTDCREEIQLPDSLYGKNLSMKVRSGSTIDEFYLSRYWWEYNLKKERD